MIAFPQKFCQRAAKVRFSDKISVLTAKNVLNTDKKCFFVSFIDMLSVYEGI